jgi:NDP-sugar pyrophosphorylase family protein
MKALVLAAGLGTRLRPLTDSVPKALLPVDGTPVIEHNLLLLREHGIREVTVNLHAHAQAIPDYLGDGRRWGLSVRYSHEETLMGTAGALKRCEQTFRDAPFVVLYGDNLSDSDITSLRSLYDRSGAIAALGLHRPEDPSASGIVSLDADGRVLGFIEKPRPYHPSMGQWANAGLYILSPAVLAEIPPETACDFGHDIFPRLLQSGCPLVAAPVCHYLLTIDTPERYANAQTIMAERRASARG